ncbi:MAG: choice-of-anchor D domain-containing protein [Xanthomonadales bacterium]|nr:choice-of-anchor D domain-containing protein [Xanthomonadales bacterium]
MLLVLLGTASAWGGGTPDPGIAGLSTTNRNALLGILGPDRGFDVGDYLTNRVSGLQRGGAVETYDYYIEVPPGQSQLVLQIFDADAGAGDNLATNPANEDLHDHNGGTNNWEMTTTYELFDPSGASVAVRNLAGQDCDPATAGLQNFCDNAWSDLGAFTISNPAPGHWRLAVGSPNTALTQEDDANSFGLRAHDGDPTAAGSEFPVYANTLIGLGQVYAGSEAADPGLSRTYDLFPFIRRDCTCESNDWDSDSTAPIDESTVFTTRTGATPVGSNGTLSQSTLWRQNVLTGWTTEANATDYGLWRLRWTTGRFNHLTYYMGDETNFDPSNAAPGPGNGQEPNSNPENGAIRLYLPADGSRLFGLAGGANDAVIAPRKPWVGQSWALVDGQPPIEANVSSTVRVTVTVSNPTTRPIQFSAVTGGPNVIVATLPNNGGQTSIVPGSATITGGSSTAASITGTGPWTITFAPGVIPAGVTALLTYDVRVTPTPTGLPKSLFLVGSFGTGTAGSYVDETCANGTGGASVCSPAALNAATVSIGPLCRLTALVTTAPSLGIAKRINGAVTDNGNGTFSVPFRLVVENLGTNTIAPLQVADNLAATFPAPAAIISVTPVSTSMLSGVGNLTANAAYDGVGNINLLTAASSSLNAGAVGQLDFSVTFEPNGLPGPFFNQATTAGTTTLGGTVSDLSDDGSDPDPDGDGIGNEPGTGCPSTLPASNCENDPTPVTTAAGVLAITPTSVPFGNQAVGSTSAASTVTLSNTGTGSLSVTALTAATAPFVRVGGTCANTLPISIAAGANCTLSYAFAPTAAVASSQTLTVTANAPGSGTIALSGTGVAGVLSLSSGVLDFPQQVVGATSTRSLTLSNTGLAPLTVSAFTAVNTPFALTSAGSCPTLPIALAPGASCTLIYSFSATTAGTFQQSVTITSDVGSGTVQLRGTAVAPVQVPTSRPIGLLLLGLLLVGMGVITLRSRHGFN